MDIAPPEEEDEEEGEQLPPAANMAIMRANMAAAAAETRALKAQLDAAELRAQLAVTMQREAERQRDEMARVRPPPPRQQDTQHQGRTPHVGRQASHPQPQRPQQPTPGGQQQTQQQTPQGGLQLQHAQQAVTVTGSVTGTPQENPYGDPSQWGGAGDEPGV